MNMMISTITSAIVLALATRAPADARGGTVAERGDIPFKVGQVWQYRTRPQEPKSTLIIFRIDSGAKGAVMHVRIVGLRVPNPHAQSGFNEILPHAPFSEQALRQSVTKMVAETSDFGDSLDAIQEWEKAHGGVWTISVSEVVKMTAATIR